MITIIDGDLLETDCKIIAHQVNCIGLMEHGVAKQIRDKFPGSYAIYKSVCQAAEDLMKPKELLGINLGCSLGSSRKILVHMFAQYDRGTGLRTDYDALAACLQDLKSIAEKNQVYEVALPYKVGCGLAGGDWNLVFRLIESIFGESLVNCKLYRLEKNEKYEEDICD